jgi:hypothetical protein
MVRHVKANSNKPNMKRKITNPKSHYTNDDHALEMFDENYKWFLKDEDGFDILPFSTSYYHDNYKCFHHNDKLEITLFITILIEKGLVEKTGNPYNIVRLTEKGKERLEKIAKWQENKSKF